jgi:hypothetical protein
MEGKRAEEPRRSTTSTGSNYGVEEYELTKSTTNNGQMDHDEEKAVELDGTEYPTSKEADVERSERSQRRRSQDSRSLRTTRSHQSRAGGDGYTCFDAEPNNTRPNISKAGVVTEQPYIVTWDGDADPENPRSMSKLRRWIIVLICSASSLCV